MVYYRNSFRREPTEEGRFLGLRASLVATSISIQTIIMWRRYSQPPMVLIGEQALFDDDSLLDRLGSNAAYVVHFTLQPISPVAFHQETVTAARGIRAAMLISQCHNLRALVIRGQHPMLFLSLAKQVTNGARWMALDDLDIQNQPFRIPDAELASAISAIVSSTPHVRCLRLSSNEHFASIPPPGLRRLIARQNDLFASLTLQQPDILRQLSHLTIETGVVLRQTSTHLDALASKLVDGIQSVSTLRTLFIPLSTNPGLYGAFKALSELSTLRTLIFSIRSTDSEGGHLILGILNTATPRLRTLAFLSNHTPTQSRGPLPDFAPHAVGAALDAGSLRGLRKIVVAARRSSDSTIHTFPRERANVRWLRHLSAPYRIVVRAVEISYHLDPSQINLE